MKSINNKNITLFSMVGLVVAIFIMAYYSSSSYRDYKEVEKSVTHLILVDKFNTILHKIEEEKSYGAIYLGSKQEYEQKRVKVYRDEITKTIEKTIVYLKEDLKYSSYKKTLQKLLINLNYTWSEVDTLTKGYGDIFNRAYNQKIVTPLLASIEKLSYEAGITNLKIFPYYIELLELQSNLAKEQSFVSYFLTASQKMVESDWKVWESYINDDVTPDFIKVEDAMLRDKLSSMIDSKYFSMIGKLERGKIFIESKEGKYSVTLKEWSDTFRKKSDRVLSVEQTIFSEIESRTNREFSLLKDRVTKYVVIFALLFISFLTLLHIYSNIDKNSRFLSNTLKDIEQDLDEKQRREIQEVIKKNDTIEIYKFLANAIKEPSRAKDHFLANMSHEIRTPLNGIIGFTTILKETELKDEQKEFLAIIEESSNNLITIVNDILDFSKVTSGKVEFENISFNVMEKFESSIDSYAAKAAQKNIELGLYIEPELPVELMGDSTKISQVMINLLSNAIKFTDRGGEIAVSITKEAETKEDVTVKFSVKDSGIGITEEQQSKIFDAFSQADASTSRKFGGTGLGLTISSKLVNLMGGKLDIESVEGEGTTFFFSIALKKSEKSLTRIKPNLEHLNVAYLSIGDGKKIDGNLDAYVKYGGASFKTYSYQEILDEGDALLADIIFVERKAIKSDMEMKALLELNRKIVILTTTEMMSCNSAIKEKISKVIYKPVNLSKTLLALNVAESSSVVVDKKVKRVNNIKSNKVFTGVKALVAEDNLINQKLIKNILNRFDISVTLVENGAEAFDAYTKGQYNIIFMDIQMPIMSGVEATEKIIAYEKESGLRHIPIVALTANVIESDKEKYLKSGMDRYLKKPIDVKELVAVIENLFPINELRDSLVLEEQEGEEKSSLSTIILYKETELTGKIYSAVLNNLGYKVDVYSEENEFLEQLDSKEYSFALFDAKPFKTINSDRLVIDLIRDSGATPIAFVEKETPINYCATLNPIGTVKEIEYKLLCS